MWIVIIKYSDLEILYACFGRYSYIAVNAARIQAHRTYPDKNILESEVFKAVIDYSKPQVIFERSLT